MDCYLVAGSYEKFLFGLQFVRLTGDVPAFALRTLFQQNSHDGHVSCVASSGHHLVSGSSDEIIKVFDLAHRVEVGPLLKHTGSITCAAFLNGEYVLVGSEDTTISVWRTKDWTWLQTLKGHKAGVASLTVHPSGKLCVSVGKDRTLKLWNLINGKNYFTQQLPQAADVVVWNPDASGLTPSCYALVQGNAVSLCGETGTQLFSHKLDNKQLACCFATLPAAEAPRLLLFAAGEQGVVTAFDCTTGAVMYSALNGGSTQRVKAIVAFEYEDQLFVATVGTEGIARVFALAASGKGVVLTLVAKRTTGARLTCLTAAVIPTPVVEPAAAGKKRGAGDATQLRNEILMMKNAGLPKKKVKLSIEFDDQDGANTDRTQQQQQQQEDEVVVQNEETPQQEQQQQQHKQQKQQKQKKPQQK